MAKCKRGHKYIHLLTHLATIDLSSRPGCINFTHTPCSCRAKLCIPLIDTPLSDRTVSGHRTEQNLSKLYIVDMRQDTALNKNCAACHFVGSCNLTH